VLFRYHLPVPAKNLEPLVSRLESGLMGQAAYIWNLDLPTSEALDPFL